MSIKVTDKLKTSDVKDTSIRLLIRNASKGKSSGLSAIAACEWITSEIKKEISHSIESNSDESFSKGGVTHWSESPSRVTVVWTINQDSHAMFDLLSGARKALSSHFSKSKSSVLVKFSDDLDESIRTQAAHAVAAYLESALYKVKNFKKDPGPDTGVGKYSLLILESDEKVARSIKESIQIAKYLGEANTLVRSLAERPANDLNVKNYVRECLDLAKKEGLSSKFYGVKELEKRKAGAFLAVAQGCNHKESGIVELHYKPKKSQLKVALVGKGLCYDTGGVNLKPAAYMFGMQGDMTGSAVALATTLALRELLPEAEIKTFLAITDNAIDGLSYRPNEVVVASNGVSIETVHTDAEGRMALADTLVLASEFKPDLMIDFATLTGSAIGAIGTNFAAVFTNDEKHHETLRNVGRESGERVWPFPIDADYGESLKSRIADTKQCTLSSSPDHIEAAIFLKKFVGEKIDWVHVDLSCCEREGGLAHIGTKVTGFGVRFAYYLVKGWLKEY